MISWLSEMVDKLAHPGQDLIVAVLIFAATLVASSVIVAAVIVRLPPDYLSSSGAGDKQDSSRGRSSAVVKVLRNLLGWVLIAVGLVLSLPGLPGQGLLTVLAGLFLVDFPGKRGLLRKLLSKPFLLKAINRLRAKFSRPPLVVDGVESSRSR